ncbi:TonB-dependent receptor [Rhodocaloribacter sp.]
MKHSVTKRLFGFVLAAFLTGSVFAQGVTTASMRGVVTDPNGDTLPGANVVAVHLPSGSEYGTATNADGAYNLRNMRVGGPYRVTVSFVGFEDFVREGIMLNLGETYRLDVTLQENAVELEEIQVIAASGIFDAERTGVATTIDETKLEIMPTIGRDLADFTRLTPQAYVENDDDDGPAISIAGQNNRFNSIFIDGAVNNDVFGLSAQGTNGGQTGSTPISIDAIEEFQIAISPFDVTQSGFTGGAINAITRSGTNEFEGSVYYFLRNQNLVGKTPPALLGPGDAREKLPEFSNNRYGFRFGGPIIKNKLFFFTNVEILRSETPAPFDVSYVGDSGSRLGELRQALIDVAGYDPGDFGDKASKLDDDKILVKLDWNISRNHKLSARHSYAKADNIDAFQSNTNTINFSNNSEVFPNRTNSTAIELNSTFGNNYANKLILGYTRVRDDRGFAGDPFPVVEINDGSGEIRFGSEPFSTANILNQDIFTITNNFNIFKGNHTITIGTHNEFYSIDNLFIPRNFGTYEYNSFDDFMQSLCASGGGSSPACAPYGPNPQPVAPRIYQRGYSLVDGIAGDATKAIGAFDAFQLGFYVQDEYQVNERLRLSGGLRVDVPKVTSTPRHAPDVFDTTIPAVSAKYDLKGARPGKTPAAALYFSPRFGFNYDLTKERFAQVRGGVGVFTGRVPFVWPGSMFLNNGTNSGFVFRFGGRFPDGSPIPFEPDIQKQFTGADFGQSDIPSGRLEIFEKDFRYPRVFRSSLGLDYELPGGVIGTLEGQYTKTISGVNVRNVNLNPDAVTMTDGPGARPVYFGDNIELDPRYSAVHVVGNTSKGYTYDVTVHLRKQFDDLFAEGDALLLDASYTYGDAYVVNDGTSSQINTLWRSMEVADYLPNNLRQTRSDFSIGHRILGSVTFRKHFLKNLTTTISIFYTGESGRPFNYTIDNSDALIGAPGFRDFGLFYVPNDANELIFESDQAASAAALNRFIESSDYLKSRRGKFAQRNGSRLPFENIIDLKIAQEVFGKIAGRKQKFEITLDIFNFTNLLNSDWGQRYNKFTSSSNGGFELIEFRRFRDPDKGDLTPVYRLEFDPERTPTEEAFFKTLVKDFGTFSSRWFMQLGFRYTF